MIPMPAGDQPEMWLLDTTPHRLVWTVPKGWPIKNKLYYSPVGRQVRVVMGRVGLMRMPELLEVLALCVGSMSDAGRSLGLSEEWSDEQKALGMVVGALFDPRSNFMTYTVWPDGRVVAFSAKYDTPDNIKVSWHPSVAGGRDD